LVRPVATRSKVYRYCSCYRRTRYDTAACAGQRIDADAVEEAVIYALASFYRDQHDLIADAIAAAQAGHAAAHHARRAEQAAARARTDQSRRGDRPVPDRVRERHPRRRSLAGRLAQLKARSGQLAARRDELASQLAMAPTTPPAPTLHQVADCIDEITASGSQS